MTTQTKMGLGLKFTRVFKFFGECRRIELSKVAESARQAQLWGFLRSEYDREFSEEVPDGTDVILVKRKIAYELQRQDYDDNGECMSPEVWRKFLGAMDFKTPVGMEMITSTPTEPKKAEPRNSARANSEDKNDLYDLYELCGAVRICMKAHAERRGSKVIQHKAYSYCKPPKDLEQQLKVAGMTDVYNELAAKFGLEKL